MTSLGAPPLLYLCMADVSHFMTNLISWHDIKFATKLHTVTFPLKFLLGAMDSNIGLREILYNLTLAMLKLNVK
jgi:hypothetical protein